MKIVTLMFIGMIIGILFGYGMAILFKMPIMAGVAMGILAGVFSPFMSE
jgi:uncharacterized membrane protein